MAISEQEVPRIMVVAALRDAVISGKKNGTEIIRALQIGSERLPREKIGSLDWIVFLRVAASLRC